MEIGMHAYTFMHFTWWSLIRLSAMIASATDFCYSYFLVVMHHNFVKKAYSLLPSNMALLLCL